MFTVSSQSAVYVTLPVAHVRLLLRFAALFRCRAGSSTRRVGYLPWGMRAVLLPLPANRFASFCVRFLVRCLLRAQRFSI